MEKNTSTLVKAALIGLLTAGVATFGAANAEDKAASGAASSDKTEKSGCKGASGCKTSEAKEKSSCKGASSCKTNEAKEKSSCKGASSCKTNEAK
ncbi:MAG TPA: hypothetical protein PLU46_08870 [Thiotrichales bacterium]|nr:hypothetical protein [Thiotrichales bacterium]